MAEDVSSMHPAAADLTDLDADNHPTDPPGADDGRRGREADQETLEAERDAFDPDAEPVDRTDAARDPAEAPPGEVVRLRSAQRRAPTLIVRADRLLAKAREVKQLEIQLGRTQLYEPDEGYKGSTLLYRDHLKRAAKRRSPLPWLAAAMGLSAITIVVLVILIVRPQGVETEAMVVESMEPPVVIAPVPAANAAEPAAVPVPAPDPAPAPAPAPARARAVAPAIPPPAPPAPPPAAAPARPAPEPTKVAAPAPPTVPGGSGRKGKPPGRAPVDEDASQLAAKTAPATIPDAGVAPVVEAAPPAPPPAPPPPPQDGYIAIATDKKGAQIQIDMKTVGKAPLDPVKVKPGVHTVWAQLAGHEIFSEDVVVQPGLTTTVNVKLVEIPPMQ